MMMGSLGGAWATRSWARAVPPATRPSITTRGPSWPIRSRTMCTTSTRLARSAAVAFNTAPASTAVVPWIAAYNGTVDLVYYGTNASSKDDPSATWNVYLAQTTDDGASFQQSRVSNTPNHVGVICTLGIACAPATRN